MFSTFAPGRADLNFSDAAIPGSIQSEREARATKVFHNVAEFLVSRGKPIAEFTPIENARYQASALLGCLEGGKIEDLAVFAEENTSRMHYSKAHTLLGSLRFSFFYQQILPSLEILCSVSAEAQPENEAVINSAKVVRRSLEQAAQIGSDLADQFANRHIQQVPRELHPGCYVIDMFLAPIKETRGEVTENVAWSERTKELVLKCKHDLLVFIEQADRSLALADEWTASR